MRTERLRAIWNIDLRLVHFPLHPETPEEGQTLERLFAGRNLDIAAMQARMRAMMAAEGLPYGDRRMTYNSLHAQELASWAVTRPGGEAIHDALYRAYFVDAINLALVDELVRIAGSVGLDEEEARAALVGRRHRASVAADWERSRQQGVTGVPTFVAAGRQVVGAQPYEVLEALVREAGAEPRVA